MFGNRSVNEFEFSAGAQSAHELILDRYLTYTNWAAPTPTNWIHFTNIGNWGNQVVERSSITEFIQYANGISAAAYYHVFKDTNGLPLDGSNPRGYVLTFPSGQLPEAMRFWSVTAYTPEAIELVDNPADKYAVASYTPPQPNTDGSVSIYMAQAAARRRANGQLAADTAWGVQHNAPRLRSGGNGQEQHLRSAGHPGTLVSRKRLPDGRLPGCCLTRWPKIKRRFDLASRVAQCPQ